MQTKFDKMRAHRERWVAQPIKAQEADAWRLKAMVVDGVAYVEAPEHIGCHGCAFYQTNSGRCAEAWMAGESVFGGSCSQRRVIYLKAE
jgi:hypothetical protein